MKFTVEPEPEEKIYYTIHPEEGYIQRLFQVHSDGGFDEVGQLFIRIDNVISSPLRIDVNSDEWSITINDKMGILFQDEFACKIFMDEIFYIMEGLNEVPEEYRTTSSDKVIMDIRKELQYMEDDDGEFDDSEISEEQGN